MFKKALGVLKFGFDCLLFAGIETFVGNVVDATLPEKQGTTSRNLAKVGGFFLGLYVTDKVGKYIDREIEETKQEFKEIKEKVKEQKK